MGGGADQTGGLLYHRGQYYNAGCSESRVVRSMEDRMGGNQTGGSVVQDGGNIITVCSVSVEISERGGETSRDIQQGEL